MTEWEQLKVAELKEELKSRGVPLTGLKLKQQLIDKLNDLDNESKVVSDLQHEQLLENTAALNSDVEVRSTQEPKDSGSSSPTDSQDERDVENNSGPHKSVEQEIKPSRNNLVNESDSVDSQAVQNIPGEDDNHDTPQSQELTGNDRVDKLPEELPAELKKEESYARDGSTPPPAEAITAAQEQSIQRDDPFIPQETTEQRRSSGHSIEVQPAQKADVARSRSEDIGSENQDHMMNIAMETKSTAGAMYSTRALTPESLDDRRKRKRRSVTPAPALSDVASKRAKVDETLATEMTSESDTLQRIQQATNSAQAVRSDRFAGDQDTAQPASQIQNQPSDNNTSASNELRAQESATSTLQAQTPTRSSSRSFIEKDVSPSIHPATCSLYFRNFKRPLHIPSLRSLVTSLASSSNQDQLTTFYLDSIRTHAFISFTSISAASRVRNAMHGTRFPDEPMREPLWIDFIPDEQVQQWIDLETGSSGNPLGGGRGQSKKYEVVYNNNGKGVKVSLQEASTTSIPQRPGVQQSQSNRMVPQDPTAAAAVVSGIHPSRASLLSQKTSKPHAQPATRPSDPGKGFRALDELFSSTAAKPKLYYKLPSQSLIDDRLDMIRGLRVNHDQMGQSGDEGMKRFCFEKDERSGREEWADKGPEFGFGRRGQERLTGFGNNHGGRGRGSFRGVRRGGDSWRGR